MFISPTWVILIVPSFSRPMRPHWNPAAWHLQLLVTSRLLVSYWCIHLHPQCSANTEAYHRRAPDRPLCTIQIGKGRIPIVWIRLLPGCPLNEEGSSLVIVWDQVTISSPSIHVLGFEIPLASVYSCHFLCIGSRTLSPSLGLDWYQHKWTLLCNWPVLSRFPRVNSSQACYKPFASLRLERTMFWRNWRAWFESLHWSKICFSAFRHLRPGTFCI